MALLDGRGRWYRPDKKDTVDGYLRLEAHQVATRIDMTRPAWAGWEWSWKATDGGTKTSSISFTVQPGEGLELHYSAGGKSIPPYTVRMVTDCPNFGGLRYWFLCPKCGRRVRYLYSRRLFLCRQCHGLTYATAQAGRKKTPAIVARLQRIRRRLGAAGGGIHDPLPDRPRGMHAETYYRLTMECWQLQDLYYAAWAAELGAVVGTCDGRLTAETAREWKRIKRGDLWAGLDAEDLAEDLNSQAPPPAADPPQPQRLTLGELATAAGLPYTFAREAEAAGLIRPDGGRGTRVKRYRPKLAAWLRKLARLRAAGYGWEDLRSWAARRWLPGHETERRYPAGYCEDGKR